MIMCSVDKVDSADNADADDWYSAFKKKIILRSLFEQTAYHTKYLEGRKYYYGHKLFPQIYGICALRVLVRPRRKVRHSSTVVSWECQRIQM